MFVVYTLCMLGVSHITSVLQAHETLYAHMRKRNVGFGVDKEFNSPGLFVGAAVTLSVSFVFLI